MIKKTFGAFFVYMCVVLAAVNYASADIDGLLPSQAQAIYRILTIFGAPQSCNPVALGAVANSVIGTSIGTDSTKAFQACVNLVKAAGGSGQVYIPPATIPNGCFFVTNINATSAVGPTPLRIHGNGQPSCVMAGAGSPTNNNWFDGSGSGCMDTYLTNFKVVNDTSSIPKVVFMFLAQNTGLNTISCNFFDHMYVDAKSSQAIIYAYGLANSGGFSGMSCLNSTFFQRNNGAPNANPSLRNAVMALDGINSRALSSDYITKTGVNPGSDGNLFNQCNFTDWPSGFGSGTADNNVSVVHVTTGQTHYNGGSIDCTCFYDMAFYTNNEGINLTDVSIIAPDGSVTITDMIIFGGGQNGEIGLNGLFWTVPKAGGCFICFDAPVGSVGGLSNLVVLTPDIGGNPNSDDFILDVGGCTSPPANSLTISYVSLQPGANNMAFCSGIDAATSFINPGTVSLGSGSNLARHQP